MKQSLSKFLNDMTVNGLRRSMSLMDDVQRIFDEFDSEAFTKDLISRKDSLLLQGNEWLGNLKDFFNDIRDTVTAFTVTVPYDSKTEEIEFGVKDNVLTVTTKFESETTKRTSNNTITIPDDCDVKRMTHTVNKDKGTATIIIPKVRTESENKMMDELQKRTAAAREKAQEAVKIIRKAVKDKVEEARKPVEPKAVEPKAKKPTAKKPAPKAVNAKEPKAVDKKAKVVVKKTKKGNIKAEVK